MKDALRCTYNLNAAFIENERDHVQICTAILFIDDIIQIDMNTYLF